MPCNGGNHYGWCECAFRGGSTRSARSSMPYSPERAWSPLRERAAELGHSLLIPTDCWTCLAPIWLLAMPDGGFAVLEGDPPPWPPWPPKHEHRGTYRNSGRWQPVHPDQIDRPIVVPENTPYGYPTVGQRVRGLVVRVGRLVDVYDGYSVYRVRIRQPVHAGEWVSGTADRSPARDYVLAKVRHPRVRMDALPATVPTLQGAAPSR
jgi:hypothetical protein